MLKLLVSILNLLCDLVKKRLFFHEAIFVKTIDFVVLVPLVKDRSIRVHLQRSLLSPTLHELVEDLFELVQLIIKVFPFAYAFKLLTSRNQWLVPLLSHACADRSPSVSICCFKAL